jgi:hypothetical protein
MGTSRGAAVKAALLTRCRVLFPEPWLVCYGLPANDQPDDIVAIGEAGTADAGRGEQEARTLGTNRSREETIYQDLLISRWRGTADQQVVTELAFTAMALIEDDLRTDPTLAGSCRTADIVSWQLLETPYDDLASGRYAELAVTVRARTRI